jgi:putative PIN family toxin of toxin-antitoxin system
LVSGFLGKIDRAPQFIVDQWQAEQFQVVISDHIIEEVSRAFDNPYFRRQLSPAQLLRAGRLMRLRTTRVAPDPALSSVATQPSDDVVIATAVAGRAEYLVTGDAALRAIGEIRGVRIVTPAEFVAILRSE